MGCNYRWSTIEMRTTALKPGPRAGFVAVTEKKWSEMQTAVNWREQRRALEQALPA